MSFSRLREKVSRHATDEGMREGSLTRPAPRATLSRFAGEGNSTSELLQNMVSARHFNAGCFFHIN
jgi:hypothetical protein